MELNSLNNGAQGPEKSSGGDDYQKEQLKGACQQFESIFLTQILSKMRDTGFKSSLFGDDHESEIWNGMLDQQRAQLWAQQGGIGLSNLLYDQFKDQL